MNGRISQPFIDGLLARTNIIDIINDSIQLKKAGKNYLACCPFHQEKTPSFTVNPDKQFFYCFGCGAAGNVINFIMRYHQLDFPAVIEVLAHKLGLDVTREQSKETQEKIERLSPLYSILQEAAFFYQEQLINHSECSSKAQHYLTRRGLAPRQTNLVI